MRGMTLSSPSYERVAARLLFAGTHRSAEDVRPHAHPCPEIILINEGSCDVNVDGKTIHGEPGDVIAMPARHTHDQVSSGYIDTVYCGFIESHAMKWIQPQVVTLSDPEFIARCMHLMAEVHLRQVTATASSNAALLTAVLEQLDFHHLQEYQDSNIPKTLRAALRFIDDNLDQPLTVEFLAEHTRMSASYLHLLFRTHLNTSPMRYLHDQRMHAARAALQSPYVLIKEVASMCGFSDVNYFVRTFRKAHGAPPGKWREQQFEKVAGKP